MPPLFWPGAIALSLSLGGLVLWLDDAYLGLCAAFLTTGSFALQVVHILKTRETKAISLGMYLAFGCGVLLWLVYGLKIDDMPVTIANSITLALASTVLLLKLRNERRT
ncbi:SemiSWEET transporter [Aeromonas rivipollensis]|uniref:SemiSWEET family sugar transporter n=1 Tax=Aeromonas rivipollensis TaxID=948519 RepID=UPI0027D95AF0|nr:SemiSWEET transporter [uncultured Aeromonas sp.]MDU1144680.1 SemiSWEET transporter [Aeromonas hydrophila]